MRTSGSTTTPSLVKILDSVTRAIPSVWRVTFGEVKALKYSLDLDIIEQPTA